MYNKAADMRYLIATLLFQLAVSKPFSEIISLNEKEHTYIHIPLVTFDGGDTTTFKFHELNDPVMVSCTIVS